MPYHLIKVGRGFKVEDDKGRTYSNKPLTKKRATQQMKALYASAYHGGNVTSYSDEDGHHMLIHGSGFITDIFAKAKKVALGAVTTGLRKVAGIVGSPLRNNYPPKARALLAKYAKHEVDNVIIRREPIAGLINTALNFISLGKWNEVRNRLNYDKLFHLSMVVQLRPNAYLLVEKNEVINITDKFKMNSDRMEYLVIPVPIGTNFWTFMQKAQRMKGDDFFKYDAFNNNCQIFIDGILSANGINNSEAQGFIMQDTETLLNDLPEFVSPFANLTTNIAGLADRVLQGEGMPCCGVCSVKGKGDCSVKGGCGMCGGTNGVMKTRKVVMKGGRLTDAQKKTLADQRASYAKDMRENPSKYEVKSFDPSEGGTKEPCFVNLALDTKAGGLNRRQSSMGYKTPEECAYIQKVQNDESRRRQYNNMSGFQKFAQGFLDVVTPIADVASNIIPGVSGQIYQQFAPPGSMYYSGNGVVRSKDGDFFGLSDAAYLRRVRAAAKKAGYDPRKLQLAKDGKHKLAMTTDDGRVVRFGAIKMRDFILWKHTEPSKADARRKNYLARASNIKGDWKNDKFSPNNLAIKILWDGA